MKTYIKVICVSDTHLSTPKLPDGDILIHAGDLTWNGSVKQCTEAMSWLSRQQHESKIFISGNHDFNFLDKKEPMEIPKNLIYLQDSSANVMGLNFFGFPWTPKFLDWAFMYERQEAAKYCEKIQPCDVLITHGMPFMTLDETGDHRNVGCPALYNRIQHLKPFLVVGGHIHESRGFTQENGITYINAAVKPFVVVIENKKVVDIY